MVCDVPGIEDNYICYKADNDSSSDKEVPCTSVRDIGMAQSAYRSISIHLR
jgi:hypothetical protein